SSPFRSTSEIDTPSLHDALPIFDATFIGVTGSNGKTSTKDLIDAVLSPYMHVQKTEGNFNNELGMPLTILALEEDVEVAVLEMRSEEHTSELQSRFDLVCRLLLE